MKPCNARRSLVGLHSPMGGHHCLPHPRVYLEQELPWQHQPIVLEPSEESRRGASGPPRGSGLQQQEEGSSLALRQNQCAHETGCDRDSHSSQREPGQPTKVSVIVSPESTTSTFVCYATKYYPITQTKKIDIGKAVVTCAGLCSRKTKSFEADARFDDDVTESMMVLG